MSTTSPSAIARATVAAAMTAATMLVVHPASAASHTECDPVTDVRLVVDGGPLGGGVTIRCVEDGAGLTAAEVTEAAGVEVTWVQRYPGAFVCRLDGRPADLPCADTPPADRFWGLFRGDAGGRSWTYSSEGAGSLEVPAGGVVGWRFQDGGELERPAYALEALPDVDDLGPGEQDPPESAPEEQATDGTDGTGGGVGSGASTLAGLLLITGLCVVGFLVMRRRP